MLQGSEPIQIQKIPRAFELAGLQKCAHCHQILQIPRGGCPGSGGNRNVIFHTKITLESLNSFHEHSVEELFFALV